MWQFLDIRTLSPSLHTPDMAAMTPAELPFTSNNESSALYILAALFISSLKMSSAL